MIRIIIVLCIGVGLSPVITFVTKVVMAVSLLSDPLTLAKANAALSAQGGMVGNIFAVGDNRYQVRRSQLTDKKGSNVFIGEIEIVPLPKHGDSK